MVSRYAQWQPATALLRWVSRVWVRENAGGPAHDQLIVPDGCLDLVWYGHDGRIEVVGPDRGPRRVPVPSGAPLAGLRFRPGGAGLLLGRMPVREVCGLQAPWEQLDDVGPAGTARALPERLARAGPSAPVGRSTGTGRLAQAGRSAQAGRLAQAGRSALAGRLASVGRSASVERLRAAGEVLAGSPGRYGQPMRAGQAPGAPFGDGRPLGTGNPWGRATPGDGNRSADGS